MLLRFLCSLVVTSACLYTDKAFEDDEDCIICYGVIELLYVFLLRCSCTSINLGYLMSGLGLTRPRTVNSVEAFEHKSRVVVKRKVRYLHTAARVEGTYKLQRYLLYLGVRSSYRRKADSPRFVSRD